jgi:hypothetical protein
MFPSTHASQPSPSLSGLGDQYLAAADQVGKRMELTQMRLRLNRLLTDQEAMLQKLNSVTQGRTSDSLALAETSRAGQAAPAAPPRQVEAFGTDLRHCASCHCTQTSTATPTRRLTPPLK